MNIQNKPQNAPALKTRKPVRTCLCYNTTFQALKERMELEGWTTVEEISRETGCGTGCGMCRPYLALLLATGETEFEVLGLPESLLETLRISKKEN